MRNLKILGFITTLGLVSVQANQVLSSNLLLAHAEVLKTVQIKYKFKKTKKIVSKEVFSDGSVKKTVTTIPICKRVKIVKNSSGEILKKKVKKAVKCPANTNLYTQNKVFRNHKSVVKGSNHVHHVPSEEAKILPNQKVDNNSCKEGSIIGGLLGAGLTMSSTRGKDRWWAVPAGGTAGALIGCQIDGG